MNSFIKKHQKKFLAVFSIGLMVTFVASSGYGRGAGGRSEVLIGHAGKTKIYNTELEQSRREWALLKEYASTETQNRYTGEPERIPLTTAFFGSPELTNAIDEKPELFMLLSREARGAGIVVSNDDVQDVITNYVHRPPSDDDSLDDSMRAAVTDLLMVRSNFARVSTDIKVSKPARDQEVARLVQAIKLNVVEFAASRFQAAAPSPTTQQVQQQFEKFANTVPGAVGSADNPFGFGYRLPDRVRLQYLSIEHNDVSRAVEASMSPYDWDVKANLHYLQNPQNYPTAAVADTTRPTTGPTTKPFALVHDEVLQQVRAPMIEKLALDVQSKISAAMQSAWSGSTQSIPPNGADLRQIAAAVTAATHVPVHVTDLSGEELSAQALSALPGIGSASTGSRPFAADVMAVAGPYLANPSKDDAIHQLAKPSAPVIDDAHNIYLYRLVGADGAKAAPDVASVKSRINGDLRTVAGYQRAKSAAEAMLTAAESIGLNRAAIAAGQSVVTTDSFSGTPNEKLTGVTLGDESRPDFIRQAFNLLSKYDAATRPNPLSIIEVPQDGRVFVAQLAEVTRRFDAPLYMVELEIDQGMRQQLMQPFMQQWFKYESVARRLNYTPIATPNAT